MSVRGVPDADAEWRLALRDARAAFRRAYVGEPPTGLDRAVSLLGLADAD